MASWPHRLLRSAPTPDLGRKIAAQVRGELFADPECRCQISTVCEAGGFQFRVGRIDGGPHRYEGLLLALPDGGFAITVDPYLANGISEETARHRIRFRLAHEIGHSFFFDRERTPAKRLDPPSAAEEGILSGLCLRPSRSAPSVAAKTPLTASGLISLKKRYDVSLQVASFALAFSRPDLSVALLEWARAPTKPEKAMRVVWGASRDTYIPQFASVPEDWLAAAAAGPGRTTVIPNFRLGGLRGECQITVSPWREGRYRRSLLFARQRASVGGEEMTPGRRDSEQLQLRDKHAT